MKHIATLFARSFSKALFVFAVFAGSQIAYSQSWVPLGMPGFSAGNTNYNTLALAHSGIPYMAFQDVANGSKVTVMKFDGANWVTVGNAGFSHGVASSICLAVAPSGTPYVAFSDASQSDLIQVMKYDDSAWVNVSILIPWGEGPVRDISIAIDNNGTPYVSYIERGLYGSSGEFGFVSKFDGSDGSNWVFLAGTGVNANWVSLAIDMGMGDGVPYLAYEDGYDGPVSVVKLVVELNRYVWQTVGTPGFSVSKALYPSIAIKSNGQPIVVYGDIGPDDSYSGQATVKQFDGNNWVTVGIPGFSADIAQYPTIALDRMDRPFVVFSDYASDNKVSVMKFDGSSWAYVGAEGFSDGPITGPPSPTSMVIDGSGALYVAYADSALGYKSTIQKFGTSTSINTINKTQAASLSIYPNPSRGSFTVLLSSRSDDNGYLTISNMLGEKLRELTIKSNNETVLQLDLPPGVYFISAVVDHEIVTSSIVVE